MKKEIASTDKTYCHAIFCDKCYKCSRYVENYKFDDDKYYLEVPKKKRRARKEVEK